MNELSFDASGIPFASELGLVIVQAGNGSSELQLVPRAEHGNSLGVVHGGVLMTLLDVAMAAAAMTAHAEQAALTVEMKTSFMRGVKLVPGQPLIGRGRLLRRTRSMAFAEASLFDAEGEFSAHATGTFKIVGRRSPSHPPASVLEAN